jgi:anti-sigma-K factor RskA
VNRVRMPLLSSTKLRADWRHSFAHRPGSRPPRAGVGNGLWNASTMWTYVAVAVGVLVVVNVLVVVLLALARRSAHEE